MCTVKNIKKGLTEYVRKKGLVWPYKCIYTFFFSYTNFFSRNVFFPTLFRHVFPFNEHIFFMKPTKQLVWNEFLLELNNKKKVDFLEDYRFIMM